MAVVEGLDRVLKALEARMPRGKAVVTAMVGYSAPYATAVHEDMERPGNKFLERPARQYEREIAAVETAALKAGGTMEQAVKAGADLLLAKSLELVPRQTGALAASGYTRLE